MPPWFHHLKTPQNHAAAQWIWPAQENSPRRAHETALFHAHLTPPPTTTHLELHLSAEGRYTLWLNDSPDALARGPARTDLHHRSLDTYSIDLDADQPIHLWAQVTWSPAGSPEIPLAETYGPVPGFLAFIHFLNDRNEILETLGTGTTPQTPTPTANPWRACLCPALATTPPKNIPGFICVGHPEILHSSAYPADWRTIRPPLAADLESALPTPALPTPALPAPRWRPPISLAAPAFRDDPETLWGTASGHGTLAPREIPHMQESPVPFHTILHISPSAPGSVGGSHTLTALDHPSITANPNERVTLHLDAGEHLNAYLRPTLKGPGTRLTITSVEVLRDPAHQKTFSLEHAAPAFPPGITDTFLHDAPQDAHTFETTHWRSFRYLQLELIAGPTGGELVSLHATATSYPFVRDFDFQATDTPDAADAFADSIAKITDISWRTLRNCAWETYMDCPYYEQLQYIGDARIQCLLTYVTTQDIALPAQALRAFDRSRTPDGLTQSRFPCAPSGQQIIPTFSLIYILMIEDYLTHTADEALVAELRPGIAPILNWFTQFINPDTRLLGAFPHWPFIDWVSAGGGWDKGIPPHNADLLTHHTAQTPGASATINLFYLLAMQSASNIYERTKPGSGNFYATRSAALKQILYDNFYDAGRGLICDIPLDQGKGRAGVWSQHAQALATLTGVLSTTEAREAMTTALTPKNILLPTESSATLAQEARGGGVAKDGRFISPASLYFRFYLAEALARLKMGDHFWPLLAPFRDAINRGSTTWPESFEPARSECHAWSAWPLYFFARHLLGIAPPSPEDNRTRIRPLHCPPLNNISGTFQTHRGPVSVSANWSTPVPAIQANGINVEVVT